MIDIAENGRSVYTTDKGTVIEKKNIFFTRREWDELRELSYDARTPIGNLIVKLARAERIRLDALA
jgi:hypothetical protein